MDPPKLLSRSHHPSFPLLIRITEFPVLTSLVCVYLHLQIPWAAGTSQDIFHNAAIRNIHKWRISFVTQTLINPAQTRLRQSGTECNHMLCPDCMLSRNRDFCRGNSPSSWREENMIKVFLKVFFPLRMSSWDIFWKWPLCAEVAIFYRQSSDSC